MRSINNLMISQIELLISINQFVISLNQQPPWRSIYQVHIIKSIIDVSNSFYSVIVIEMHISENEFVTSLIHLSILVIHFVISIKDLMIS